MLKNYLLTIEELNYEPNVNKNLKPFNLNTVLNAAKSGNTTLLEQLFCATKIKVYEYQTSYGKDLKNIEFVKQSCICTPKQGRNILRENISLMLPSVQEMVAHLVYFHNASSDQTNMDEVSLKELVSLHEAAQPELIG